MKTPTTISSGQSRRGAAIETVLNTASGFVISWLMWVLVIGPIFGLDTGPTTSFGITTIFTITSLIRTYVWRRLFNKNK